MNTYLEHANMTVPDIDAAIDFLLTLEPEFFVRHREFSQRGYNWAHVGSDDFYIALQEPHSDAGENRPMRVYKDVGVNHLAWVVNDLDEADMRLTAKGFGRSSDEEVKSYHTDHRKRIYFFDHAGFEWELIEYLTDDRAKRNTYNN